MKASILALLFVLPSLALASLETEKQLSKEYLEKVKAEPNTQEIEGGVLIRQIFESKTDEYPNVEDEVTVMYEGFDREGKVFDSSFKRDSTATSPLDRVITCWQAGVAKMSVGSVYKLTCPSETAYGDRGAGDLIKPGAAISFRVILLKIKK